jgi:hypothetical protein
MYKICHGSSGYYTRSNRYPNAYFSGFDRYAKRD